MDGLRTTAREKIFTYVDAGAIADVAASEAMDLSWEEGVSEIEAFFDVDAYVDDVAGATVDAPAVPDGQGDVVAEKRQVGEEVGKDDLRLPVEGEAAGSAPVQEGAATAVEEEKVPASDDVVTDDDRVHEEMTPTAPGGLLEDPESMNVEQEEQEDDVPAKSNMTTTDDRIPVDGAATAPDELLEDPESMDVEHVTASVAAENDATDTAPPEQPHFTNSGPAAFNAGEDEQIETTESGAEDAIKTRTRQNSMNIAFIVTKEDEVAQTTTLETATEEAGQRIVNRQEREDQQLSSAPEIQTPELDQQGNTTEEPSSSPASNILAVPAQKTEGADSEQQEDPAAPTPSPISAASQTKSTPNSSLPARPAEPLPIQSPERLNTPADTDMTPAQDSPVERHPPSSEGKSSLMDEMRREDGQRTSTTAVKSAVGDDEEAEDEDEDAEGSEDEEFRDAASSPVSFKERLQEVRNEKEASEAEAVDDQANERLKAAVEQQPEQEVEVGVKDDGDEMIDSADSGTELEVYGNVEDDSGAGSGDGDVKMPDLPAEADSQAPEPPVEKTKKGTRTRKATANARPQTRRRSKAAVKDQLATATTEQEQDSPAPAPGVQNESSTANEEQEDAPTTKPEPDLSEDELAASSPLTIPRKRKASNPTATTATAAKKAKTIAFAPQNDVIGTEEGVPRPADADDTTKPAQGPRKRLTKAEIRASKQPKQRPRKSGPHHAVGLKELRGLGLDSELIGSDGKNDGEGDGDVAAERDDEVGDDENAGRNERGAGSAKRTRAAHHVIGPTELKSLGVEAPAIDADSDVEDDDGAPGGEGDSRTAATKTAKKKKKTGGTQNIGARELKELTNTSLPAEPGAGDQAPDEGGDEMTEKGPPRKKGTHPLGTRELKELGKDFFSATNAEDGAEEDEGPAKKKQKSHGWHRVGFRELEGLGAGGAAGQDGIEEGGSRRRSARMSTEAKMEEGGREEVKKKKDVPDATAKAVKGRGKGKKGGKK